MRRISVRCGAKTAKTSSSTLLVRRTMFILPRFVFNREVITSVWRQRGSVGRPGAHVLRNSSRTFRNSTRLLLLRSRNRCRYTCIRLYFIIRWRQSINGTLLDHWITPSSSFRVKVNYGVSEVGAHARWQWRERERGGVARIF